MKKEKISIIGQLYNEEQSLPLFYIEMKKIMDKMKQVDFELIFINDGSTDKSVEIIKQIIKKDKRVKLIDMSRNFGREACAMAGFKYSTGDYITTMDVDLQDPPELIEQMYDALKNEKYDIAAAKALTRKGYSFFHKLSTKYFFKITNKISSVKMVDGQREYRLMTRQVVTAILQFKEYNLFNKGLLNDVGFKVKWIEYENVERIIGDTKFPYSRMIKYAINGIIAYSVYPLNLILYLGMFLLLASFIFVLIIIILVASSALVNYTLLIILASLLLLSGIIVFCLGVISLYLAQIHTESKHRPIYIVKEFIDNSK